MTSCSSHALHVFHHALYDCTPTGLLTLGNQLQGHGSAMRLPLPVHMSTLCNFMNL